MALPPRWRQSRRPGCDTLCHMEVLASVLLALTVVSAVDHDQVGNPPDQWRLMRHEQGRHRLGAALSAGGGSSDSGLSSSSDDEEEEEEKHEHTASKVHGPGDADDYISGTSDDIDDDGTLAGVASSSAPGALAAAEPQLRSHEVASQEEAPLQKA